MRILYISYFGALKHLSQTQVIPYLEGLARDGMDVTLLTFEERSTDAAEESRQRDSMQRSLAASGIDWHWLRYHKSPSLPATAWDVLRGTLLASRLVRRKGIDAVHARSHVPAAMALAIRRLHGVRLVFDLRGLWAEEYVDAGRWKRGSPAYRITKWVERRAFLRADAIVMLTRKAREVLSATSPHLQAGHAPIEVIPCCVQVEKYLAADGSELRKKHALENRRVMVYAGSLGGWYLTHEMAELFAAALRRDPRMHLLVLTQSPHRMMSEALGESGIPDGKATLVTVSPDQVPAHLAMADFALMLIKPCFSKLASSPTKVGEYLAAGLPFIANAGIGDVDDLLARERVGVLLAGLEAASYTKALGEMDALLASPALVRARCRQVAEKEFSMRAVGREGYRRVYRSLGWEGAAGK